MEGRSKLFEPYRALGLYSSGIPHCTRYHQKHQEHYMMVAVGRVFQTYNCSKLGITQVSDVHPGDITCIATDRFFVYTGCGNQVRAFEHNRNEKYIYKGHEHDVRFVMPFAEHLVSIDKSSMVKIWHIRSQELHLDIEFNNDIFQITAVLHPSTYVNKILFGSSQGAMQLWNIRKNVMLYHFKDPSDTSSIICMAQSPAVDVIGVGRKSGNVIIHNLKVDQEIMRFKQIADPVIGIAFRTDGPCTMLTGGSDKLSVWDLEEKRLLSVMDHVHNADIAGMSFLSGQPLLLTNSADNSIKVWAFDQSDGTGRLLRNRSGHSLPPTKLRFHDEANLISAAQDSTMRVFSLEHEAKNKSMGQASMNRAKARKASIHLDEHKLPPVLDFVSTSARQKEWDNIIAFHHNSIVATTWNLHYCRMGSHKLCHDRLKPISAVTDCKNIKSEIVTHATAVAMTQCGNFCLIGYNTGDVDMFNMQSGIYRGSFTETNSSSAHKRQVTGICVNPLNQIVVTTGYDGTLRFWRFKAKKMLGKVELSSVPSFLCMQGENSLIAVALDDFSVEVYDFYTRNLARRFSGFHSTLTDMTWSSDGHQLIVASMDCTIRTYELSTSLMVDCFLVDTPAVTVALSPNSDMLATSHVGDLGIYLWFNTSIYGRVHLDPLPADYHPTDAVELPYPGALESNEDFESSELEHLGKQIENCDQVNPLDDKLITLARLSTAKWVHLTSLDIIKKRNKAKQLVVQPKIAPFFLPTISGLSPTFDLPKETEDTKIVKSTNLSPSTEFASLLQNLGSEQSTLAAFNKLKEMGPSAIDLEIRCLSPDLGGSVELMSSFLSLSLSMLKKRKDFEFVESVLGLFMRTHGETIASDSQLIKLLSSVEVEHNNCWRSLRKDTDLSICLLDHWKSVNSYA